MRAIIMAGGRGMRLQPYTSVLPKSLIPLDDLPILQIILLQLRKAGVTHVTLAVCHKAQQITRYFGNGNWLELEVEYAFAPELFGTAGPLGMVESFTEPALVLNADILTTVDFADVYTAHCQSNAIATMVIYQHSMPIPYGVVETNEHGQIRAIVEKPQYTCMINTGIYVLDPAVRKHITPGSHEDMPNLLLRLVNQGYMVSSYRFSGDWIDIGTLEQFRRAQDMFRSQRECYLPLIDRSSLIHQGVEIGELGFDTVFRSRSETSETTSLWR